jgi:hypothetical protein
MVKQDYHDYHTNLNLGPRLVEGNEQKLTLFQLPFWLSLTAGPRSPRLHRRRRFPAEKNDFPVETNQNRNMHKTILQGNL